VDPENLIAFRFPLATVGFASSGFFMRFYLLFFALAASSLASDMHLSNGGKVPVLVQFVNWGPSPGYAYRGVSSLSLAPGAREVIPLPSLGAGRSLAFSIIYGTEVAQGYTFGTSAVASVTVTAPPFENSDYYLTWSGNYYYGYYGAGAWQARDEEPTASSSAFPLVLLFLGGIWFSRVLLNPLFI